MGSSKRTDPTEMKRARSDAQKDARRRSILSAASALAQDIGLDQVRVEAIARAAGVAKGTVYLYYETKEAVFIDLYEEAFARWLIALTGANIKTDTAPRALALAQAIASSYLSDQQFVDLHGALGTVLWPKLGPDGQKDARNILEPGLSALGQMITAKLDYDPQIGAPLAQAVLVTLAGFSAQAPLLSAEEAFLAAMVANHLQAGHSAR